MTARPDRHVGSLPRHNHSCIALRHHNRMPKIRRDNLTPLQKRVVLARAHEGIGLFNIALEIGKSRTAVRNYLREQGLYRPRTIQLDIDALTPRERIDVELDRSRARKRL